MKREFRACFNCRFRGPTPAPALPAVRSQNSHPDEDLPLRLDPGFLTSGLPVTLLAGALAAAGVAIAVHPQHHGMPIAPGEGSRLVLIFGLVVLGFLFGLTVLANGLWQIILRRPNKFLLSASTALLFLIVVGSTAALGPQRIPR